MTQQAPAAAEPASLVRERRQWPQGLRLRLAAQREALEPARLAVLDLVAAAGAGSDAIFRIELVLEESLMNIVWHAYPDTGDHEMELEARLHPGVLSMVFQDAGRPFDPTQARAPVHAARIEDAVPGGFGLFLVRQYASRLEYRREGQRNVLQVDLLLA